MPTYSTSALQPCAWCYSDRWMNRTERLLSASCMGLCLEAAFKEHPKSTALACSGGALSMTFVNILVKCHPVSPVVLNAGVFVTLTGVTVCMKKALDDDPAAAMKACLAGALSICLARSVVPKQVPEQTLYETPKKSIDETPNKWSTDEYEDLGVDLGYSTSPTPPQALSVGKELKHCSKRFLNPDFERFSFKHVKDDRICYKLF